MAQWTHRICQLCWEKREPERIPVRLKNVKSVPCCFCGDTTASGIFVREDPKTLTCQHPEDD